MLNLSVSHLSVPHLSVSLPSIATVRLRFSREQIRSRAAQDMPLSQVLMDGEGWQLLSEGHAFTEGPAADKDGNVFFTDIPHNRIHKITVDGKVSVFAEETAKTNGLMIGPDGRLYGCRNGDRRIISACGPREDSSWARCPSH